MKTFPIPILTITHMVFFPHTIVSILIYKPNDIKMIKDCLLTGQSIAIALSKPRQKNSKTLNPEKIATVGRPILLEESSGGALKLIIRGEYRVELLKLKQRFPYLLYEAREAPDIKESGKNFDSLKAEKLKDILFQWINDPAKDSIDRQAFIQGFYSLHHIIDYLAMFLVKDLSMKQLILENSSLVQRLQILSTLLRGKYPHCEDIFALNALKDFESAVSYQDLRKCVH